MLDAQQMSVKGWLVAYRNEETRIDSIYERIRRMESKIMSAKISVITDMPKSFGGGDSIGEYVVRKEQLQNDLDSLVRTHDETKRVIKEVVKTMDNPAEKMCIVYRYVAGYEWSDVCQKIFGGLDDYVGKKKSYLRRTYRIHDSALKTMAKNWEKH